MQSRSSPNPLLCSTEDLIYEKIHRFFGDITHERQYKLEGKGLFVIIRNNSFPFDADNPLNDRPDQRRILSTFKLLKEDERPKKNVIIGEDLREIEVAYDHNAPPRRNRKQVTNISFESFMDMVTNDYKNMENHSPSFVMFFLMSHGYSGGQFLLSYDKPEDEKNALKSVPEDIIKPIQEAYKQIPKIFVIQTCRGGDVRAALPISGGGGDQPRCPLTRVTTSRLHLALSFSTHVEREKQPMVLSWLMLSSTASKT